MRPFYINNQRWELVLVPPWSNELVVERISFYGVTDGVERRVYIDSSLPPDKFKKVLTHELAHALIFAYEIELPIEEEESMAQFVEYFGEEITLLSEYLYEVRG